MTTETLLKKSVSTVRRTRRAYLGAHVVAFEFAQKRAKMRFGQAMTLGEMLVSKGETVETDAKDVIATAKDKVEDKLPRKAAIKAEVKAKAKTDKPAKTVTKKAKPSSRKRITTDKTVAAKPVAAKPSAKAAAPKATKTDDAPAAQVGTILKDKYTPYQEATVKYVADANPVMVKKIVDHLGVALNSRDGKFVACSDEAERKTVATSWLIKKLGVVADASALDAKISAVCETMKADRMKNRVAFYYLLAQNEGKLGTL